MADKENFFDSVYNLTEADQAAAHYAKFARDYDTAMAENGYATPARCAEAMAAAGVEKDAAILDIGCGTGLSGVALAALGYNVIDGLDFSAEMLEIACSRAIYRTLSQRDLRSVALDTSYHAALAAGVLNPAHAPAHTLDDILQVLEPGGVFVFSLNDHAISDGSYEGRIHELLDTGAAACLSREYGEHMPGQDLKAWVYALRKR